MKLMTVFLNIYFYGREKYGLFLTYFTNLEIKLKAV